MQLWQNQHIVDTLVQILTDYDYLKYDEETSERNDGLQYDGLHVKVIHQNAHRHNSDACEICERLGRMTGRLFYPIFFNLGPDRITPQFKDYHPILLDNAWTSFDIYEHQYR